MSNMTNIINGNSWVQTRMLTANGVSLDPLQRAGVVSAAASAALPNMRAPGWYGGNGAPASTSAARMPRMDQLPTGIPNPSVVV